MRILDVNDPPRFESLVERMKRRAWDVDADFDWGAPIDLDRPLVPTAEVARMFPGLDPEQEVVLSQAIGLGIAGVFSDAEEFLDATRRELRPDFERLFAARPHLLALGEQFFDEERKHAETFRRYLDKWFVARGLDPGEFRRRKLSFLGSPQQAAIHRNARAGGLAFWWLVLIAEEESPLIYKVLDEAPDEIEPLYLRIHRKHFEEEARHATFAYTAMALLADEMSAARRAWHRRTDVMLCQALQWSFFAQAMVHQRSLLADGPDLPWTRTLRSAMARIETLPKSHLFRVLFREPTLLSPFLNYRFHANMVEMSESRRLWTLPLPRPVSVAVSPVAD